MTQLYLLALLFKHLNMFVIFATAISAFLLFYFADIDLEYNREKQAKYKHKIAIILVIFFVCSVTLPPTTAELEKLFIITVADKYVTPLLLEGWEYLTTDCPDDLRRIYNFVKYGLLYDRNPRKFNF